MSRLSAKNERFRLNFMTTDEKLDELLAILKRIEERQIKTTAMVTEVKEAEAPVVGGFGTIDHGDNVSERMSCQYGQVNSRPDLPAG